MDSDSLFDLLSFMNPWWATKAVPKELAGWPRQGYELLIKSVYEREVTVITGVRRAGKSTLMYQTIAKLLAEGVTCEQVLFVNFDDLRLEAGLDEIYKAYREKANPKKKAFVFFDEVHKQPGWESWVRTRYDQKNDVKVTVSGSCSYLLAKEFSTLLTGRNLSFAVYPFGFSEYSAFKGITFESKNMKALAVSEKDAFQAVNTMESFLSQGGFPEPLAKTETFRQLLLSQYFEDLVQKDVVDRFGVNSVKAKALAQHFLATPGALVSLRKIRAATGLSYDTTKDYLSHFQDAFLFFLLEHFSYSFSERKSRPCRVYCIDNGLRNAVSFKFSKDEGKLAENAVLVELLRRKKDAYYWKNENCEVDFIVKETDGTLLAINVCYSDEIPKRETEGLLEFEAMFRKNKPTLLLLTRNSRKKIGNIQAVPLWQWITSEATTRTHG